MVELKVKLQERSYSIFITDSYGSIGKLIADSNINGKIAVITDQNVNKHQSKEFVNSLESDGYQAEKYIIEGGERSKSLETVNDIYNFLVNIKFDRDSTLIALGGGVVGDVTGYAAATFLRGIKLIQVPTSLLAQVDSSVGGKVGVNFKDIKNVIGSFYQPQLVYINTSSLATLPERELRAGLAEVLVHAIIADPKLFDYIENNISKVYSLNKDVLNNIIETNCTIKSKIIEQDEKENGIRAILNFGHTIGHAIESVFNFRFLHGECISVGIVGAFKIALHLGMVEKHVMDRVERLLCEIGLPTNLHGVDIDKVYSQMLYDKKKQEWRTNFYTPQRYRGGGKVQCQRAKHYKKSFI